jgi:hypothetical protein
MLDCVEYSIDSNNHQGNGNNGYDRLDGDWLTYYKVGKGFTHKVRPEDREDFLHDLLLTFARVKANYDDKGKELTTGGLVRIAQYQVNQYWRDYYKLVNGIDCGQCSRKQRLQCKRDNLYGSKCPKAIKQESLNQIIEDGNGDKSELYQLIADDNAEITDRLEARLILGGYPR